MTINGNMLQFILMNASVYCFVPVLFCAGIVLCREWIGAVSCMSGLARYGPAKCIERNFEVVNCQKGF